MPLQSSKVLRHGSTNHKCTSLNKADWFQPTQKKHAKNPISVVVSNPMGTLHHLQEFGDETLAPPTSHYQDHDIFYLGNSRALRLLPTIASWILSWKYDLLYRSTKPKEEVPQNKLDRCFRKKNVTKNGPSTFPGIIPYLFVVSNFKTVLGCVDFTKETTDSFSKIPVEVSGV